MMRTFVAANITKSKNLRGAQRSPEFAFRSTDFCVPENLLFPALANHLPSQVLWPLKCVSSYKCLPNIKDVYILN